MTPRPRTSRRKCSCARTSASTNCATTRAPRAGSRPSPRTSRSRTSAATASAGCSSRSCSPPTRARTIQCSTSRTMGRWSRTCATTSATTTWKPRCSELPEHQRVPLVLFHFEDMPYEEIAQKLRVSLPKVKTDIHRARQALGRHPRAPRHHGRATGGLNDAPAALHDLTNSQLERLIGSVLRQQPLRRAPATLEARVLRELELRAAQARLAAGLQPLAAGGAHPVPAGRRGAGAAVIPDSPRACCRCGSRSSSPTPANAAQSGWRWLESLGQALQALGNVVSHDIPQWLGIRRRRRWRC